MSENKTKHHFYQRYVKRLLDCSLSLIALVVLSPLMLILIVLGAINMKGNPFFTQKRPGKGEKIFNLIKFRTMTCEKDTNGNLLSDDKRLNAYGKTLRSTSLDELPELFNIVKADMSIIGPRPLLVQYLPYYTDEERHRHAVRPGITGLAQVSGRNVLPWSQRFALDVEYTKSISFTGDVKIILKTIQKVLTKSDILVGSQHVLKNLDDERSYMVTGQPAVKQ